MQKIPYSEIKKGTFLIASPEIQSGIFFRSVVLLCDHSSIGSFGIVVNKPLDLDITNDLTFLSELGLKDFTIRAGGPNQPTQMMLLHGYEKHNESNLDVCEGVYLGGDLEILQEIATSEKRPPFQLCLGFSAWGAGHLEQEFLSGAWYLFPATKEHVFATPPEKLWQTLLSEMGGKYKTLSAIPENLELN